MYQIDVSENVFADMAGYSPAEIESVLAVIASLGADPKPPTAQPIPYQDAGGGILYRLVTKTHKIYYHIFEAAQVIKVELVDRRHHLN